MPTKNHVVKLDQAAFEPKKADLEGIVAELQDLKQKVDELPFIQGRAQSAGPVVAHMTAFTIRLKSTVEEMEKVVSYSIQHLQHISTDIQTADAESAG